MLVDDYIKYYDTYKEKFGDRAVVLMQVGSFFELYSKKDERNNIGYLHTICRNLDIQLTRKDKSKQDESPDTNPYMAGVPNFALQKYLDRLLNMKYIVILIEQVTPPPNPIRKITEIVSQGTNLSVNKPQSNYINCIYVTDEKDYKTGEVFLKYGITIIECSTGKSIIYESGKDNSQEDVYRFIHSYYGSEIVLYNLSTNERIIDDFELTNVNEFKEINKKLLKIDYQNEFLNKIYPNCGLLSPIEYLDLEYKPYSVISFILLLDYIYLMNPKVLTKINVPEIWTENKHLILTNNTLYQLNIINNNSIQSNSKIRSLLDIIDYTSTAMGKRELKNKILNPILDKEELNRIYEMTDLFKERYKDVEESLKSILDIERYHRKLLLKVITPYEFGNLDHTYDSIIKLHDSVKDLFDFNIDDFNKFYSKYQETFVIDEMVKYNMNNIGGSFINKGINPDIDKILIDIEKIEGVFKEHQDKLLKIGLEKDANFKIKFEYTDKDGFFLSTTTKRSNLIKDLGYIIKKHTGSNVKIITGDLKDKSDKLFLLKDKIKSYMKIVYLDLLKEFSQLITPFYKELNTFITNVDIFKSYAKMSIVNVYSKPIIEDSEKSYLKCKDLRHPIIEKIQTQLEYIGNDINLGDVQDGILLFSANGVGKSSLMKAIGICIIMAQAGMHVPCSELIFSPYKTIFSRIIGTDNIFKGLSSFAVEMGELKTILKYS